LLEEIDQCELADRMTSEVTVYKYVCMYVVLVPLIARPAGKEAWDMRPEAWGIRSIFGRRCLLCPHWLRWCPAA